MHSGTIVHYNFNWASGAGDFRFYCRTQSLIIIMILIKLKSHKDKCHGYGSILYLGCLFSYTKNRMDEADKKMCQLFTNTWQTTRDFFTFSPEERRVAVRRFAFHLFQIQNDRCANQSALMLKHFFRVNDSSWALISGILEKNKTRRWIHHVKK